VPTVTRHHVLAPILFVALLLSAVTALPAFTASAAATSGCVSNAEHRRLAQGQRLAYVRRVAGDDAQIGMRRWTRNGSRYQERRYAMCTPSSPRHDTLTTRFTVYQGAWRAYLVDTYVGPE
jgi:hypothetical protein